MIKIKKQKNIIYPILFILIFASCEDNTLISTNSQISSVQGVWQEKYYGNRFFEYISAPDSENQIIMYQADSIKKISLLTLYNNSFYVSTEDTFFVKDSIYITQNNIYGSYTISNSTITFTGHGFFSNSEEYVYKLDDNYLDLIYAPIAQANDSLIPMRSDMGIPWGCSGKVLGKFTKVDSTAF